MKLLVYPAVSEEWVGRIVAASPDVEIINCGSEDEAVEKIVEADGMYGIINPTMLKAARRLRWIQTPVIGLERYLFRELIESPITMTNVRGIFSDIIADHIFGFIIGFCRGFHHYHTLQKEHRWEQDYPWKRLCDQTLGIIGLGGIGVEVAKRGQVCGMTVIAVDPRAEQPPEVETLWRPPDGLTRLLEASDFVVICAPHTPETEKMIRRPQLQRMKRTAYFINIGRGVIVDLQDLTDALNAGEIAGAGLDVFEKEPLPPEHPLWGMENVLITPHVAGNADGLDERRLAVLIDNLKRFCAGEPLRNVVDKARWF